MLTSLECLASDRSCKGSERYFNPSCQIMSFISTFLFDDLRLQYVLSFEAVEVYKQRLDWCKGGKS